jgi:phosphoglycolate phosphatase
MARIASGNHEFPGLVLFDIDGTLLRRAGSHHREALVEAVWHASGVATTMDGIPVAGMLDRDIAGSMLRSAGASEAAIRRAMPGIVKEAQRIYVRTCPDLRRRVCPGVRLLLYKLSRRGLPAALVTGNLTRIGWTKMERAGLRHYFRFGAFAELAHDRAGLVRIAVAHAKREKWIGKDSPIALIGDHPNDVRAARANGIRSIAVGTGIVDQSELLREKPDVYVPDMRSPKLADLFG